MNCKICSNKFDLSVRKPCICIPCGHTFCKYCLDDKSNSEKCIQCQNEIETYNTNYSLLDMLELEDQTLTVGLVNEPPIQVNLYNTNNNQANNENDLYLSPNHKHPCRLSKSTGWYCNGYILFGNCKSNLDNININSKVLHFECTICYRFDLCEKCFKTPKKLPSEYFYSENHKHRFNITKKRGWYCDGYRIYGKCLSNQLDTSELDRFKCAICDDYDLCKKCLNEPLLKKTKSLHHKHELIKQFDEEAFCYGEYLFGECKLKNEKKNFYKCTRCYDFNLCEGCFNAPEPIKYNSPNHDHLFIKYYKLTGWRCDGNKALLTCRSGLDSVSGQTRYKCTVCDDFDYCEACLNTPKVVNYSTPNHISHNLIERVDNDNFENIICDGLYLFGNCQFNEEIANKNQMKLYGCLECNFDLCSECLEKPLVPEYSTVNHEHKFRKYYHQKEWYCEGYKLFESLLCGTRSTNQDKYFCIECGLSLCDYCFNAPDKNNLYEFLNYQETDISSLFYNEEAV